MTATTDHERSAIRAAIDRLLTGTPLRSDGALTVVSLATEADIKRHVLTHRHTDLKDEFYAKVRAQGHVPDSERKLRDDLRTTRQRLAETLREKKRLEAEIEEFARVVNVLEVENAQLRAQLARPGGTVTPLPGPR